LAAYGPATHRDFAQWFGMRRPSQALALARELSDELEEVEVEGQRAWLLRAETATDLAAPHGVVHLLPHFDCYLIGCHPRQRLFPPVWAPRALTHGGIGNLPLMIVDGIVAGRWRQRRTGRRIEIAVEAFQPLTVSQQRALEAAGARIGKIMEAEQVVLALGAIDARPHL